MSDDRGNESVWVREAESAPWTRRDSMGHVVYDGKMWILGGFIPERVNDVWHSTDGRTWTQATAAAPWDVRNLPNCLVYDGKMWLMAGGSYVGNKRGNEHIAYNDVWNSTDGVSWNPVTLNAAWSPRSAATAIVYDDKMWLIGGMTASNGRDHHHDVWYSSDGENWEMATDYAPWSERSMHTSVVFDGRMWVMGGGVYDEAYHKNSAIDHNDVWYSTDGENWHEVTGTAAWPPRRFHRSVVYDGKMWVIGGAHFGNRNDVWYSSDGETWRRLKSAEIWPVRHEPGALVYDDKLWIIGGFGKTLYNDVWSYTAGGKSPE